MCRRRRRGADHRALLQRRSTAPIGSCRRTDTRLHYVEAGAGEPILLIPGAFTTYRAWNRVLAGLSLHARVLAVDYVGVGDSDKPETGFDYYG